MQLIRIFLPNKALFIRLVLILVAAHGSSCAYRFSNSFQKSSRKIQSICVESAYPTAQVVTPFHHLWEAIQRRIATDGSFILEDCDNADAILLTQVVSGRIVDAGTVEEKDPVDRDPKVFDPAKADHKEFRRLESAKEIMTEQIISYDLKVELVDLTSRKILFSRLYSKGSKYTVRLPQATIQPSKEFTISDEAQRNSTRAIGAALAGEIVSDLRSSLSQPRMD